MAHFRDHLMFLDDTIGQALIRLDLLAKDAIIFIIDKEEKLIGSLTDGDVRRGLIKGKSTDDLVGTIIQESPKFITKGSNDINKLIEYREQNYRILPVIDNEFKVVSIINFRKFRSFLPIDAVIMAGGRGQRLQPLTDITPKPLLKVGNRPILEHNLDRLASYGISNIWITVRYLGKQIADYFGDGENKNIRIEYVWEDAPLGTIGSVSKINNFNSDYILVTNSDLLCNVDYEEFFLEFLRQEADLAVLTIPNNVSLPYAVLEINEEQVTSLKEKPTYTYFTNGGVYLMKRKVLELIPDNSFFNATDLIEELVNRKFKVFSFAFSGYWLDIGQHEDYKKAQKDILRFKF